MVLEAQNSPKQGQLSSFVLLLLLCLATIMWYNIMLYHHILYHISCANSLIACFYSRVADTKNKVFLHRFMWVQCKFAYALLIFYSVFILTYLNLTNLSIWFYFIYLSVNDIHASWSHISTVLPNCCFFFSFHACPVFLSHQAATKSFLREAIKFDLTWPEAPSVALTEKIDLYSK